MLERQYPVVVEGFGYVPDTEGAGKYRGALAVYRQWRFLQDAFAIVRRHQSVDAPGLNGGSPGKAGRAVYNPGLPDERDLPQEHHLHLHVNAGDKLYLECTPSGGHSDPFQRDPARVLFDVIEEKVSVDGAAKRYGVVIDRVTLTVDSSATRELRKKLLTS